MSYALQTHGPCLNAKVRPLLYRAASSAFALAYAMSYALHMDMLKCSRAASSAFALAYAMHICTCNVFTHTVYVYGLHIYIYGAGVGVCFQLDNICCITTIYMYIYIHVYMYVHSCTNV